MNNGIDKHYYEKLIFIFSGATVLLALGKIIIGWNQIVIPHCLELSIAIIELAFAGLIFTLGFWVSPVDFIHLFRNYCKVCASALKKINKPCEIYTIQTPVLIQHDTKNAYENYLDATAEALVKLDSDTAHMVSSYRRLVVVNSTDPKEKENEKLKLTSFVEALFSKVKS